MDRAYDLATFAWQRYEVALIVLAIAWSLGRALTRRVEYRSELEAGVLSVACGLGALATGLFLLAALGLFRRRWVVALLAVALIASWKSWRALPALVRKWRESNYSTAVVVTMALVGFAAGPLALLPLYPPTEFDGTMFHLPFAKAIASGHRLDFFSELRYPVFPALQHTLYALGLELDGDVVPAILHTASFALVAVLLFVWGRELSTRRAGLWAALLWLGTPVAVWTGTAPYVDCSLALFGLASLFCLARYARERQSPWLFLGGAFAAFAAGTKYHGLFFVALFLVTAVVVTLRAGRPKRALLVVSFVALLMLPWYGYVTYFTYNPVFPFAPQVFGWSPWALETIRQEEDGPPRPQAEQLALRPVSGRPVRSMQHANSFRVLLLPVNLFLHPEHYRGRPAGPFYALTPFLILGLALRHRHALLLGAVAVVYGILWRYTALDTRYLLPVLPLAALLGCEGLDRLLRWRPHRIPAWPGASIGGIVTLLLVAILAATTGRIALQFGPLPIGLRARLQFVQEREEVLGAIRAHNRLSPAGSRVYGLFCENLRHFSRRQLVGDWNGEHRYVRVFRHLSDPADLYRRLRAMKVTYLILPDTESWHDGRVSYVRIPRPEELASHFEVVYSDPAATLYRLRPPRQIPSRTGPRPAGPARPDPRSPGEDQSP